MNTAGNTEAVGVLGVLIVLFFVYVLLDAAYTWARMRNRAHWRRQFMEEQRRVRAWQNVAWEMDRQLMDGTLDLQDPAVQERYRRAISASRYRSLS